MKEVYYRQLIERAATGADDITIEMPIISFRNGGIDFAHGRHRTSEFIRARVPVIPVRVNTEDAISFIERFGATLDLMPDTHDDTIRAILERQEDIQSKHRETTLLQSLEYWIRAVNAHQRANRNLATVSQPPDLAPIGEQPEQDISLPPVCASHSLRKASREALQVVRRIKDQIRYSDPDIGRRWKMPFVKRNSGKKDREI